ncbi:hypothetical protein M011DRAFT_396104 [Sporormia fimetaria CBS 119925]|uniref:Uncharacterized protein n=1 Tax=Sporormia fimetaria CBS 119925 TaxID=1340428 RepID=A0A6A6VP81_9PLEO|nr:hypothetical protein M011DRAFT_396104 [Sporormia fimetaria CBS 119925]
MAFLIDALSSCFPCYADRDDNVYPVDKAPLNPTEPLTAEEIATELVDAILSAEKGGRELFLKLDNIVNPTGWSERVAEWLLVKLEAALRVANKLSPYVKDAYDKACEAAKATEGFVLDHPVFCTVIALGVLVIIAPWVIEALGFAELGPVEGSFAAAWQARYAGYVPKGSLFSFFQRLGMIWH